jgi:hypothetical protein
MANLILSKLMGSWALTKQCILHEQQHTGARQLLGSLYINL